MTFEGAVIKEQGVTFAIAVVRRSVLQNATDRDTAISEFSALFQLPTVLMAQDNRGRSEYWGRPDIVKFLANVHPGRIPWRQYTI